MNTKQLSAIIIATINKGAPLFNMGKVSECEQVYRQTSQSILENGGDELSNQNRNLIQRTLEAVDMTPTSPELNAWKLRETFDRILEETTSTSSTSNIVQSSKNEDCDHSSSSSGSIKILLTADSPNDWTDWVQVHDNVMGGESSGSLRYDSTDTSLSPVFEGTVSDRNNGGFASIRKRVSLSAVGSVGVFLEVRNKKSSDVSGRIVSFMVKDLNCIQARGVNYKMKFQLPTLSSSSKEYHRFYLPFDGFVPEFRGRLVGDMPPLDLSNIQELSFMVGKPVGDFSLEIKSIGLYK